MPEPDSRELAQEYAHILDTVIESGPSSRGQGMMAVMPEIVGARDLEEGDVVLLDEIGPHNPSGVRRITGRHHEIARRLAMGLTQAEVARDLNMSATNLSLLVNYSDDFAFLLDHYQRVRTSETMKLDLKLKIAANEALERLDRELQENEDLSPEFLLKATTMLGDRAGHGPVHKSESKVALLGLTAEEIAEIKKAAQQEPERDITPARPSIGAGGRSDGNILDQ